MIIYRLFCRVTGKNYIGATRQRLATRLAGHRHTARQTGMKGMQLLARAIREHGWESFDVFTLARANSIEELMEMEHAAVLRWGTLHPDGYNQLGGGGGWLDRPTQTGRPAWNKGVPAKEETKALLSSLRTGGKNPRTRAVEYQGIQFPSLKSCREATGLSYQQAYRRIHLGLMTYLTPGVPGHYVGNRHKPSPEARRKMSEAHSGAKHYRARAILIDGVAYPSITDAARDSDYSYMQLKTRLKDGRATYLTTSRYIH